MAKILILGGTGAIGRYVVNELAGTAHSVFVTSRKKRDSFKNIHYLQGDAKQLKFLNDLCQQKYDCIVDFMFWGTEEFKKAGSLLLAHTGHYVFLSSYRVYADADMLPLRENSPLLLDACKDWQYLDTDEYALAKARCERLIKDSNYKNYTILRPAITFSTNRFQLCTLEADLILPRSRQGKPLVLAVDMMDKRAAVSWAGMAGKMIAPLLLLDEAKCEIFNIGTRESHTWKTIAAYYHELLGSDYVLVDTKQYLKLGFSRYQTIYDRLYNRIIDNSKIIDFLDKYSQPIEIPPIWESLRHEISLNRGMNVAIGENFRIGNNMDKYILDNVERINPVYGDHFQLLTIVKKIRKLQEEETGAKSLIKSAEELIARNDFSQALKTCEIIRQRFPQNVAGYLKAHDAYFKSGDFARASEILEQGMKILPNEILLWIASYNIAFSRKDYSRALERALEMIQNFPKVCSGYFRAASAYTELGEFEKAEEAGRRAVEITPDAIVTWLPYAEVPMRQGNYKLALERFAEIRTRFPNEVAGYTRAADVCFIMGDLDQSLTYCKEYLNSHPVDNGPLIISYNIAMRRKDFAQALEISLEMQKNFPHLCSGYFRAASVHMELGEFDKAEEAGLRAVEITPDAPVTWLVYADIPMRQGNFELALERLAEVRKRFPNELAGYARAAHACKKLGDFNKARDICEQGMKVDDNAFEILSYTIAEIMAQAPENYFSSIDYLNKLYENCVKVRDFPNFYRHLFNCGTLLIQKFSSDKNDYYFKLIIKLFLTDCNGRNSYNSFLNFLHRCGKKREEYYKIVNDIIESNNIFSDFSILVYKKSTIEQKKQSICNILRLNDHICVLSLLGLTNAYDDYKIIITEILDNRELLQSFSDYGLYILLNLFELLNMEKAEIYTNLLLEIKDENSHIYPFLLYRKFYSQLLRSSAPVRSGSKRLRVAICVSGQLRGYRKAFESWNKTLNLEEHDTTYFVHTWKNIGRKLPFEYLFYPRVFTGEFLKAYQKLNMPLHDVQRNYLSFYELLEGNSEISRNDLATFYNTENVVIEDEKEPKFNNFNNAQKMYYKIFACNELLHHPMREFDLVIRIRPDFFIGGNIDLRQIYEDSLASNSIYANPKCPTPWSDEIMLGDTLAIGTQHLMDIYSKTYIDYYKFKNINLFQHKKFLGGHLSLSYQLYAHGIYTKFLPFSLQFMDPSPIHVKDIYEALQKDIKSHPKITYEDQVLINACEKDLMTINN